MSIKYVEVVARIKLTENDDLGTCNNSMVWLEDEIRDHIQRVDEIAEDGIDVISVTSREVTC